MSSGSLEFHARTYDLIHSVTSLRSVMTGFYPAGTTISGFLTFDVTVSTVAVVPRNGTVRTYGQNGEGVLDEQLGAGRPPDRRSRSDTRDHRIVRPCRQ